jgi:cell division protease FtsH
MVGRWGMSEELGPVDVRESDDHPFLGREVAMPRRFSEATASAADKAVRQILAKAEARATKVLQDHRSQVAHLIEELEARETLEHEAVIECLRPQRAQAGQGAPHEPSKKASEASAA